MHEIVVSGHICLDLIPIWNSGGIEDILPGHLITTDGIMFSAGGVVSNTGISLKRLGMVPILIGKIGNDVIGKLIINTIRSSGKELSDYLIVSKEDHSSYTIVLSPPNSDRAFLHYPGANDTFSGQDIEFNKIKDAKIFHFGYPPVMKQMYKNDGEELIRIFDKAHEFHMLTSLDMTMPDPNSPSGKLDWKRFLRKVLPHTDVFLPSIGELLYMMRVGSSLTSKLLQKLSDQLIDWGTKIVVIKLGENGIYFRTRKLEDSIARLVSSKWEEREFISPAFVVKAAGTTGAGDASVAGFLAGFVRKMNPVESVTIASAVGAFCAESVDSTSGIKPLPKVLKRVRSGWGKLPVKIRLDNWKKEQSGVFLSSRDRDWSEGYDH